MDSLGALGIATGFQYLLQERSGGDPLHVRRKYESKESLDAALWSACFSNAENGQSIEKKTRPSRGARACCTYVDVMI
jgi:hypothetical protein